MTRIWSIVLHDAEDWDEDDPDPTHIPHIGLLCDVVLAASRESVLDSWAFVRAAEIAAGLGIYVDVVDFNEWEAMHIEYTKGRESEVTTHTRWRERKAK